MDGIFISYRRDDSAGYAGRLYDRLSAHFGADQVFMDVEGIELGTDFVTAIEQAVGSCKVLIVVIGDEWLSTTDAAGRRRLDDPHDFVRLETRVALEREIRVVPVLVGGALMPRTEELPDELKSLARRQAIEISHKQWDASTRELIRALNTMLGQRPDTGITVPGDVPVAQTMHSQAGVAPDAPGSPEPGGDSSKKWMVGAALVTGVLGVALWLGKSESPEPTPKEASSTPLLTAQAPPSPGNPPAVVAAAAPTKPARAEPPVAVAAGPATAPAAVPSPTPPPVAAVAPQAPPTPSPPVIRLFQSQGDPAGAKLCYSVALAESVTLTPQPGALAKPVKDCVTVAVAVPTTFTLTARNGHGAVTRTLSVRPRPVEVPTPVPVAIAPTPSPVPVIAPAVAPKADSMLPRAGESWTYRTSGKWPTSPRRDIVIAVESVRDDVVTDTLRADAQERTAGDTRRLVGSRPGFMAWQQIGPEYSPYLGAFRDLSSLGPLSNFATPDLDTWGQWYSEAKVVGRETVNVPGGSFDAFKVEVWSSRSATGGSTLAPIEPVRVQYLVWYAPNVKRYVKMQRRVLSAGHREIEKDVFELVAYR